MPLKKGPNGPLKDMEEPRQPMPSGQPGPGNPAPGGLYSNRGSKAMDTRRSPVQILLAAILVLAGAIATIEGPDGERPIIIREDPSGSIDIFKSDSSRVGYGTRRPDGSLDLFHPDGSRLGYIQPGSGKSGSPTRIILSPTKRR